MAEEDGAKDRRARLFVAVELPASVRDVIGQAIREMQERGVTAVRWVRAEGVHLTLKFLGETPESRLEAIVRAMALAAAGAPPFELHVQGAGAFPNMRSPRVVWLGLHGQVDVLQGLQAGLEEALAGEGFPKEERAFTPHLTLGRIDGKLSPPQLHGLAESVEEFGSRSFPAFPVDGVSLVESLLERTGARYVQRNGVPLGQRG
ncbi:MAG: RNA 2',3'-cyclic phosphodiesterase [Chloroflexi bacterium]|nr:RNA 2',3'-cyclic phosphodiesterase [Chloroflexota bacterium]